MTNTQRKIISAIDSIKKIEQEIYSELNTLPRISVFTGTGSFSLFYHMLYTLTGEAEYHEKFKECIDNLYERINSENYSFTYCDGLGGIAFLLNLYRNSNILPPEEVDEALFFFDEVLISALQDLLNAKDQKIVRNDEGLDFLDLLHGAFGVLYYFTERMANRPELSDKITALFHRAAFYIKTEELTNEVCPESPFNCGMAHGVVGHIIVFSKFLEQYPNDEMIQSATKKCVATLMRFESQDPHSISRYPSIVNDEQKINYEVPLGWCYGDQTTALAIYKAGEVLNQQALKDHAIKIMNTSLERDTVIKSSKSELTDAAMCHGMSSVAYLHKRCFQITGNRRHMELYDYFKKEALTRGMHPDVKSGYKKYMGENTFIPAFGLLDGSCGIGIFLIDSLTDTPPVEWDKLFLIR